MKQHTQTLMKLYCSRHRDRSKLGVNLYGGSASLDEKPLKYFNQKIPVKKFPAIKSRGSNLAKMKSSTKVKS